MSKKEKTLEEELKEAQIKLKDLRKVVREHIKQIKMVEKGELPIEEIKPFFEGQ
jgi:5-bromo-4-chloroindolyl phosphate hydrolysis protein